MEANNIFRLLPALSGDEYAALKEDIRARGVLIPIELDRDGNILDGFERKRACDELGIKDVPSVTRPLLVGDQKIDHLLRLNLARRNLSKDELKKLAVQLRTRGWPQKRIAMDLAVSQKTISNWLDPEFSKISELTTVIGKDGKHYPGKKTDRRPKQEPHVQQHQEGKEDEAVSLFLDELHCGEDQIQEHSVDLMLTHSMGDDPHLWDELATLAKRVLKPGKLFVFCTSQKRLPEIIAAFSKHLQYVWAGMLLLKDMCTISELNINSVSKLLLFFAAPVYQPGPWFFTDAFEEDRYGEEGGMEDFLILTTTNPGDVIFDPRGSETVRVAAKRLKRQFVRTEKNRDSDSKTDKKPEILAPTPTATSEAVCPDDNEQLFSQKD